MALIQRDTPYPHWEFSDPSSGDLLRIVPERGGLISGWRCAGHEVVYLDLERFLDPAQSVRGGFPVLAHGSPGGWSWRAAAVGRNPRNIQGLPLLVPVAHRFGETGG
jgi:hypothetical protein